MTDREKIRRVAEDYTYGDEQRHLREDYSGRGMFGRTCWGIVTAVPADVIAAVGVKGAKMDSMGRRTIVYWPKVSGSGELAEILRKQHKLLKREG
jgi:hypothetical protein